MMRLFGLVALSWILMGLAPGKDGYEVGDKASDFSLKNVDGSMVSLADYPEAKGFIVVFTCNHCPCSVFYEDRIIALDKRYKPQGYPVIAINPSDVEAYPSDSYENMKIRSEEKGYTFPYLMDDNQRVAKMYGARKTPHVFVLEKKRKRYKVAYIGAIDDKPFKPDEVREEYVINALESIKAGEDPQPSYVKAFGCSIKWKEQDKATYRETHN